jgi:hypothetical protein
MPECDEENPCDGCIREVQIGCRGCTIKAKMEKLARETAADDRLEREREEA